MLKYNDIRQLQEILVMRKIAAYLIVIRYLRFISIRLQEGNDKEQEHKAETFTYDPVGNRTNETTDTGTTSYTYNANRLISSAGEKPFSFSFDANGNTTSENTKQYIYNQNQRLTQVTDTGTVLSEYVYNGKGQRVKKTVNGQTTIFHYDQEGLLIAESTNTGAITNEYIYLNGQPLAKIGNGSLSDTDGDGILDDGDGSGIAGDNPCTGGNTVDCDDNCIDTHNSDQADTDNDGVGDVCDNCTDVYNPDQRDTNSEEDDNTSVAGEQHYGNICDPDFDNNGIVGLEDYDTWVIYFRQTVPPAPDDVDLNGNGIIDLGDFNIWRTYYNTSGVPGPGRDYSIESSNIYYYHNDHLGTPMLMSDEDQTIVWEGEFLPFGEAYSISGTITNNLRFPGQYYDSETGLHYNYFRDYKPEIGRYVEADPILQPMINLETTNSGCAKTRLIWFVPGLISKPQNLHPYAYVENNPVNFTDPLGLGNPYRCEILKTICMEYCATKCKDNSEEYFLCLGWCEGPGKIACFRSPGRGEYPENPYCKDEDECKDKK